MRCAARLTVLTLLLIGSLRLPAQNSSADAPHEKQTWYDALLKQFNPNDLDYGAWLEKRRQSFLEATVRNPYFWYSALVTALEVCTVVAYWKRTREGERTLWVVAGWIADLYNHDLHSRNAARDAIDRYNRHIEQCNHALESAGSGNGRPGWGSTHLEELKEELRRKDIEIERVSQERNRLQDELTRKAAVMSDLSLRVDALRKTSAPTLPSNDHREELATGERMRLVQRINQLEEELYASQQQNKRVKGG